MKYIFMVAGKGTRLQPLTLKHPKSMYKLDENTTLLQRMVMLIKKHDEEADIVIVTGHMHRRIEEQVVGVRFVYNPFYEVTNSIASLWFAKIIRSEKPTLFPKLIMPDKRDGSSSRTRFTRSSTKLLLL